VKTEKMDKKDEKTSFFNYVFTIMIVNLNQSKITKWVNSAYLDYQKIG